MLDFLKFIIPCVVFVSCQKDAPKIKSEKGGIDIITNVYLEASKGLDSVKSFYVSKLNYENDKIVELVPNLEYPQFIDNIYFIQDSLCFNMGTPERAKSVIINDSKNEWFSVYKKNNGAVFFNGTVPNYSKRKNIADTILLEKKYRRFEITTKDYFARYYIYLTDTIFPYSLNSQIDKDYSGRLERIDSYDKNKNIFITVQLLPRKKIDEEAQDIFEFQKYAQKRK